MDATRVSKLMFGRPCRLPVAAWVRAHDKRFHQSQVPTFGTTSQSNIKEELLRMVEAEMLVREEPGYGRVYYEQTDSPLWAIVDLAVKVTGMRWEHDRLIL